MGQTAFCANTGEIIEAFSLTDLEWELISCKPIGSLVMPRTGWPAVPKVSIRGLRFFAHAPGYPEKLPTPESYAHTRLKIDVLTAARNIGLFASIESPGESQDGESWVADVLVTGNDGSRTAFEVQLSSQHLNDYRMRTMRYQKSGVRCCWILSCSPAAKRLTKAVTYENIDYYKVHGEFKSDLAELLTMSVAIDDKSSYPDEAPVLRFGRGEYHRELTLLEAVHGVIQEVPQFHEPYWIWGGLK